MSYTLGLDLGQAADFSALVIDGHTLQERGQAHEAQHIQRWPLGTPYPAIVADVVKMLERPALAGATLVIDGTGCGRPVVDLFRAAGLSIVPVLITGGDTPIEGDDGYWRVPKRDLVSVVQVCLQTQRLKIARALPDAAVLQAELLSFQAKITTAGNDTYGEWRDGKHDDLVLALALALWHAERGAGVSEAPIVGGQRPYRAWTPRGVVMSGTGPFGRRRGR